jgi:hypothetical protein
MTCASISHRFLASRKLSTLRQCTAGGLKRGQEVVVSLLVDKGADVNAQGGAYGNALQTASYRGHEAARHAAQDISEAQHHLTIY